MSYSYEHASGRSTIGSAELKVLALLQSRIRDAQQQFADEHDPEVQARLGRDIERWERRIAQLQGGNEAG
jgi:hypothetical protein